MKSNLIKEIIGEDKSKPTTIILTDGSKIAMVKNKADRFWLKIGKPTIVQDDIPEDPFGADLTPIDIYDDIQNDIQDFQKKTPKKEYDKKYITLYGELVNETPNAFLISDGSSEFWIPKSQTKSHIQKTDDNYEFEISEWIAKKKGII